MHVPDGFINAPVSVAAGAVAVGAVAVSLRGARRELSAGVREFTGGARSGASAATVGTGALSGAGATGAAGAGATGARAADPGGNAAGGERTAPLAGLVAAFIFAVQMLNFPVAAGTSGHLLGGALAAILVGPYTGVLCVSVVLLMQGVLFADGGLTALGVNILDMGVVTVLVAYVIFRALLRVLPSVRPSVTVASFVAALISVPASAIAFTGLYAIGGTADVELGRVFAAMTGVHVLIGLGEAAITAATVGAVVAVRPDLVYGARELAARPLQFRTAVVATPGDGSAKRPAEPAPAASTEASTEAPAEASTAAPADASAGGPATEPAAFARPGRSNRGLWLGGLAATMVCAGVVSFYASGSPDGLEKVAADNGIDEKAEEHAAKDSPLADYGVASIADSRISGGLAGVIGAGATLAAGSSVFVAVRRRRAQGGTGGPDAAVPAGAADGAPGSGGPSNGHTA